jgi:hypothetical protein
MDQKEAFQILGTYLAKYQTQEYTWLAAKVGAVEVYQVQGESNTEYQIEVEILWDDKDKRTIRVLGGIDDGGWRAFVPLCRSVLIQPEPSHREE